MFSCLQTYLFTKVTEKMMVMEFIKKYCKHVLGRFKVGLSGVGAENFNTFVHPWNKCSQNDDN